MRTRATKRGIAQAIAEALKGIAPGPKTKFCRRCLAFKPHRAFNVAPRNRDKLQSWCKSCVHARVIELRKPYVPKPRLKRPAPTVEELAARKERRRRRLVIWRRKNRERILAQVNQNSKAFYARRRARLAAIRANKATVSAAELLSILEGNKT